MPCISPPSLCLPKVAESSVKVEEYRRTEVPGINSEDFQTEQVSVFTPQIFKSIFGHLRMCSYVLAIPNWGSDSRCAQVLAIVVSLSLYLHCALLGLPRRGETGVRMDCMHWAI